jgi:hypothetical protein
MATPQKTVFLVQHLNLLGEEREDTKLIGVYQTRELAQAAVDRLKNKPGFRDHPRVIDPLNDDEEVGFYISEYELDKDQWEEGYVTKVY